MGGFLSHFQAPPQAVQLTSVAYVTGWFAPSGEWDCANAEVLRRTTTSMYKIPVSPHPFGADHSFVISNSKCPPFDMDSSSWTVLYAPELDCSDAESCAMTSKLAKMPFVEEMPPKVKVALEGFSQLLYADASIHMSEAAMMHYFETAQSLPDGQPWSLLLRRHEASTHVCDVNVELGMALTQPRYLQAKPRIEAYMAEHPGVPTDGVVHNTGLLLWNLDKPHRAQTRALMADWYNATTSVTAECQITFYYVFRGYPDDAVVSVPFGLQGVSQWHVETLTLDTPPTPREPASNRLATPSDNGTLADAANATTAPRLRMTHRAGGTSGGAAWALVAPELPPTADHQPASSASALDELGSSPYLYMSDDDPCRAREVPPIAAAVHTGK